MFVICKCFAWKIVYENVLSTANREKNVQRGSGILLITYNDIS